MPWQTTLGLRHVIQQGSRFHIVDYTTKNHRLLSDRVLTIEEDVRHNIWAATEKGLVRIDKRGHARILLPHVNFLGCYANGNRVLAFSKINQTAYVFDLGGRLLCRTTLPQNIGHIGAIKGCVHSAPARPRCCCNRSGWAKASHGYGAVRNHCKFPKVPYKALSTTCSSSPIKVEIYGYSHKKDLSGSSTSYPD